LDDQFYKKSHLIIYLHVLEHLNDNVCYNKHVQENVKNSPEVDIKLTVHSNKLCSCFEESDNKVKGVAEKTYNVKDVADFTCIAGPTFYSYLNDFLICFKYLPSLSNHAQENNTVPWQRNKELDKVRKCEKNNVS